MNLVQEVVKEMKMVQEILPMEVKMAKEVQLLEKVAEAAQKILEVK